MKQFGLIGYPLGHSFSKKYFTEKFEKENIPGCNYELYPIESIDKLPELIKSTPGLKGLNVTIPYKQDVFNYLDETDKTAKEIGAVNCIKITNRDQKYYLKGFNTDCTGFELSFKPHLKPHHTKALILGTGGAAKAVEYTLKKLGIDFYYVSRTPRENVLGYKDIDDNILNDYKIIINTSPLGMHPNTDAAPSLPYKLMDDSFYLYDLVYNPQETMFMQLGKKQGATVKNGLEMLYGQAEKAWEIWNK